MINCRLAVWVIACLRCLLIVVRSVGRFILLSLWTRKPFKFLSMSFIRPRTWNSQCETCYYALLPFSQCVAVDRLLFIPFHAVVTNIDRRTIRSMDTHTYPDSDISVRYGLRRLDAKLHPKNPRKHFSQVNFLRLIHRRRRRISSSSGASV